MGYYATGGGSLTIKQPIPDNLRKELNEIFNVTETKDDLDLYFDDKYHSDIDSFYQDLAPYVTGSIEFMGEDDAHWRIVFENDTWREDNARIVYDTDPVLSLSEDLIHQLVTQLYDAAIGTDGKPSVQFADPSDNPSLRRISDVLKRWHVIC